jgi:NAD(P)-dependent dehydrogenase (short-subunit alcohol dehydrogenase family)
MFNKLFPKVFNKNAPILKNFCQTLLFKDNVVIVTGGSQGIGRATCIEFAKEGARVLLSDIKTEGSQETVNIIKKNGGECSFFHSDVSKDDDCRKITDEAVKRYGKVNVLVNNAAVFMLKGFSATREEWLKSFDVNVMGTAFVTKYAVEELKKQKNSAIVNVSSISAYIAQPDFFVYTTSKAAIHQMTRNLALDLAPFGIRVNSVSPGTIKTPAVENHAKKIHQTMEEIEETHKKCTILGRTGEPVEVANGILFLASHKASYITGTSLLIDGGYTTL